MHHDLEESDRAHLEITLHFIDLDKWEYQTLSTCHALHCEETFVQALESIVAEFETVIDLNPVMDQCRRVDDRVFTPEK